MSRRLGRLRRLLGRVFRERQIYHRSDGVVHFISMSSRTQIALAFVMFVALMWVAYSSVNVVFKEQIIVAKDRDYRVMETTLNERIHDNQKAYDDISALNVLVSQNFEEIIQELSQRNQRLEQVVGLKQQLDKQVDGLARNIGSAGGPTGGLKLKNANRLMIDPIGRDPTPRQSRLPKLRRAAYERAMKDASLTPANRNGREDALTRMRRSAAALEARQVLLMAAVEEESQRKLAELTAILDSTGIPSSVIIAKAKIDNDAPIGVGGPFIDALSSDEADSTFFMEAARAGSVLDRLVNVGQALSHVPLALPLDVRFRYTSGFGYRHDPFNGRVSRHLGEDMAAPLASPVHATAAGTVVYAGFRGGYGRSIDIDHGNGFVTRFGHLHKILVKRGQKVKFHQEIGLLGTSGRSSGPHVHYEVRFNGVAKDPMRFIEAGRYVYEG